MANSYHAHISDPIKQTSRSILIIAESFHDAYGLARGVCKGNDQIQHISEGEHDVIICPQVAKDASKHA